MVSWLLSISWVALGGHIQFNLFYAGGNFANYWLAPNGNQGSFILKFDEPRTVSKITVVNTHNGGLNDRGTRTFEVCKYV